MCRCETWLLTLRMFENTVLKKIFAPNRGEGKGNGKNYIMRSFRTCTPHPVFFE